MSVVGIIAEFNPFHSGHEFLLNQARLIAKSDPIIVLMSGNYVQRGEMAILNKWDRAQAALRSGADLVFEMPLSVAAQPADLFSRGGLEMLAGLGATDLVFGTEDGTLNFTALAERIAKIPKQDLRFHDYTQTYATQYNQVLAQEVGREVNLPNEILGVAYAVANLNLPHPLNLHAVQRIGADHRAAVARLHAVASATSLRNLLLQSGEPDWDQLKNWLPKGEIAALQKQKILPSWNLLFPFLKYRLESSSVDQLRQIYQMSEGLEYKFKAEIHTAKTFTQFLQHVKSKRYTYSRLRRLSLYTLLDIKQAEMQTAQTEKSALLLGFSERGRNYLKLMRQDWEVPVISKVDHRNSKEGSLSLQVRADRLVEQAIGKDQNFGRRPIEVE
ncbi:MAG: nucleotidyltransferase [Lactobacillus sp.]|jgi:predicted nucleotidyltransferase|nr:nucleotidyltransferase [Lactobacillus sp.]MCH3906059.1 nucleotidyltransferase [Lactobacillus sp.]MCH3990367.1 nucleotidyltransferase [Lactobacillus sp.]MCH4068918.1 nucleotidyltransferase [Lactobacillus sp.]MCI1303320.1 nucleotidyltransferase [Lactobacillus sp.]